MAKTTATASRRKANQGGRDYAAPRKMELAYQTDALMQHGVFPKEFVIYYPTPPHPEVGGEIEGSVDEGTTRTFINAMTLLESYGKEGRRGSTIRIIMNCLGGDEYQGMAVYDTIRQSKFDVTIEGRGAVMSMGAFIMQSADRRLLSANARVMVHSGTWGAGEHHYENYIRFAKEAEKLKDIYLEVLWKKIKERKPKFTREKMEELLRFDKFMSAREAVSYGLADYVIRPTQK
ncbi:MAG: ATP-dependent Clp protease proteolytic subunit [Minisyncoccia bacterium]